MRDCLRPDDINKCLNALPSQVRCALKAYPEKVCVAGGFIRAVVAGETPNDIDIFVDSERTAMQVASDLAIESPIGRIIKTGKAYTITGYEGPAPQVIFKWTFPHSREVIDAFDFTIAQAALWWDGNDWESNVGPNFYEDVAAKRLMLARPIENDYPGTFLRVLKFYRAGYAITNEALGEVLAGLCQGLRPETLLGTESHLSEAFAARFPQRSNGKY